MNPNATLPVLPEGYSWWIDEYDLRILQNNAEDDYWSDYGGLEYREQPDHDGRFYDAEEKVKWQEYTETWFLLFSHTRKRAVRGTMITNVRHTVVSRLQYYDSMYLERGVRRSQEDNVELWRRIKADGVNTTDNIEGRAKALKMRFDAIQENKEIVGHYPPKTLGEQFPV